MVGQNFRDIRKRASPQGQNPILKIEISEDEVSGDETLAITMPGRQRRQAATAQKTAPGGARKVRFEGETLKSAMKKAGSPNDSSETLIDTSDDDSSDMAESDTSDDDTPVRRRRTTSRSRSNKLVLCKKMVDSEDSSAAKDALPHPTCSCDECTRGRKILKAVIKYETKVKGADGRSKKKEKDNHNSKKEDTSTEAADTNASEAGTTDPETTEEEKAPAPSKKDRKKEKKEKQKTTKTPSPPKEPSRNAADAALKSVDKNVFKLPTYPKEMQPQFIMPPHHKVMRVEHTIEGPHDPKPNAFFDSSKGIARVYHGPLFSNHMGELYSRYNPRKGTQYGPAPYQQSQYPSYYRTNPQAPHNSWWSFPNAPHGAHMPPTYNPQMHSDTNGTGAAPVTRVGLSGMTVPPTPDILREEMRKSAEKAQKAASQKSASENGSKKGTDHAANGDWNAGGADQTWGTGADTCGNNNNTNGEPQAPSANADPPADAVQGWDTGSKQGNMPPPPPLVPTSLWTPEPKFYQRELSIPCFVIQR